MKKISIITALIILAAVKLTAQQNDFQMAWNYFNTNDLEVASAYFKKALNDPENKSESLLMLSMISNIQQSEDDALDYFIQFSETVNDINPYMMSYFIPELLGFGGGKQSEEMVAFLTSLHESGKLKLAEKGHIEEVLADHYYSSNKMSKANTYYAMINSVSEWQITGVFDNISESGFNKNYPPISVSTQDSIFKDKYNHDIHWYEMVKTRSGKWNDFTQHFYTENSVIYAQTFCYSPVEQEVVLRVGTSGSLKTWVNDNLMFQEPMERNNGMDTYMFTAKLNEGYNRILLQVGSSVIDRSNFMFRVSDLNEQFVNNITFTASHRDYTKDESNYKSVNIPLSSEEYFSEQIQMQPDNLLNHILLINAYLATDKNIKAIMAIDEASKLAPESTHLKTKLLEAYYREDNYSMAEKVVEDIKISDPTNPRSLMYLYNEAMDNEDYSEAESLLNSLIKITGDSEVNLIRQISICRAQGKVEMLYDLIEKGYKRYPENSYFVESKYNIELAETNNYRKAGKILTKYLKENYDEDVMATYGIHLGEKGNLSSMFSTFEQIIDNNPGTISNYYAVGMTYYLLRDYYSAAEYFQQCQEFAPFVDSYYRAEGDCWAEVPDRELTIAAYAKALQYDSHDHDTRDDLRVIEYQDPVFDYFETPDTDSIIANAKNLTFEAGDACAILHHEKQKVIYDGGATESRNYKLVKILNDDGIENMKEYTIYLSGYESLNVEKAEIIKPNGRRIPADKLYNELVFTSLEQGDIILIEYTTKSYGGFDAFSKYFEDYFYIEHAYPVMNAKYCLLVSNDADFKYHFTQENIDPEIKDVDDDFTLYTWETGKVEAIKYEAYVPFYDDVAQMMLISNYPDWKFFVDWYNDVTTNKIRADYIVKAQLDSIMEGHENAGELEKARLIYNYITSEISYSSVSWRQSGLIPKKASEVITDGLGDCKDVSVLFVSMCRELGIDANLVLTSSRYYGFDQAPLPEFVFNHCIAKVNIDGEQHFVELVAKDLPFGALSTETKGAFALEIVQDDFDAIEPFSLYPETRVLNTVKRETFVSIKNDSLTTQTNSQKSGVLGYKMNYTYKNQPKAEQEKIMQSIITADNSGCRLLDLSFGDSFEATGNKVDYSYSYVCPVETTKINDLEIVVVKFTDDMERYSDLFGLKARNYPLEIYDMIAYYDEASEVLLVSVPEGKSLEQLPEDVIIKNDYFSFSLICEEDDGLIILSRTIEVYQDRVSAADYQDFKEDFNKVMKSDKQRLVFKEIPVYITEGVGN
jgi:transglutaminase-like putative cysteine protease/uncharacterized protein HemY